MALKPCRECKKDVSSEAKSCPHCGVKDPTKPKVGVLKAAGYGVGTLVLISMCTGAMGKKEDAAKTSAEPQALAAGAGGPIAQEQAAPEPAGLQLVSNEKTVLKVHLTNALESYARNAKGLFAEFPQSKEYVVTTADELQRAYEKNEVAGDKQYKDRKLLVSGRVDGIKRSIGENYYITLVGGTNMFMRPHASMADGYGEWLAQVNKGEQAELACEGGGMLMGSAMLKDCVPTNVWAARMAAKLIDQVPALIESGNTAVTRLAAIAIGTASLMPTSQCWTDSTKCLNDVVAAGKLLKKDPNVRATVEARLKTDPALTASLFN